jgi:hypothetical protein
VNRVWVPGEKAFPAVPADRLLGRIVCRRLGAPGVGVATGWRFEIAQDTNWHWLNSPTVRQRTYLVDELKAWRGRWLIPPQFDFTERPMVRRN